MNRSRPVGSLGGGGWENGSQGAPRNEERPGKKKDKVLADMYEMFLDSLEPDIIQSVVLSFNFNHEKSFQALSDMCGSKDTHPPVPSPETSAKPHQNEKKAVLSSNVTRNASSQVMASTSRVRDDKKPAPSLSSSLSSGSGAYSKDQGILQKTSRGGLKNHYHCDGGQHPEMPLSFSAAEQKKSLDHLANDKMAKIRFFIERGYRIMVLMRGCSGSGKSYLAQGIIKNYGGNAQDYIFSTDDYFIRNGVYRFDHTALSEAHHWNQTRVLSKAREGCSPIIVDNTNTQLWEMTIYASMAINNGYAIEILEPETAWFRKVDELSKRNRHGVPRDKIKLMLDRYEFGITAEGLIKSTGAKYSKPIPQPAEYSLFPLKLFPSGNQETVQAMRSRPVSRNLECVKPSTSTAVKREQGSNYSSQAKLLGGNQVLNSPMPKEPPKTAPDPSTPSLLEDGFYFGPSASQKRLDMFQTNQEPQNQHNSSQKLDGSKSLFDILTPTQSEESQISVLDGLRPTIAPIENNKLSIKGNNNNFNENLISSPSIASGECGASSVAEDKFPLSMNSLRARGAGANNSSVQKNAGSSLMETFWKENLMKSESEKCDATDSPHKILKGSLVADYDSRSPSSDSDTHSNDKPMLNSNKASPNFSQWSDVLNENSGNAFGFSSLSDLVSKSVCEPGNTFDLSALNDYVSKSNDSLASAFSIPSLSGLSSSSSWIGTANWDVEGKAKSSENDQQRPKPPRGISMKNIQEYCDSVKDMNSSSQNKDVSTKSEASRWSTCDNSFVSWQSIDELQGSALKQDLSQSCDIKTSQRSKFNKKDCVDVGTNTHHTDFCILNNLSIAGHAEDAVIINAHDRDINEGRSVFPTKVPLKLMLDKGTFTENDFENEHKTESKQEKMQELMRLFPNRSPASIKELLKQCNWDVNYVSNLLLDVTDNEPFIGDVNEIIDGDSDEELAPEKPQDVDICPENETVCSDMADDNSKADVQVLAEEVKRHIEQSIDFSERCYSPHTLAIKNFRRGTREGAVPKSNPACGSEALEPAIEVLETATEDNQEEIQNASESSDGDNETLEFILSRDFIQQLVDKFGGSYKASEMSPVVKFPISLARQIYDTIISGSASEEEEDDGDFAMKLQCEEDERLARQMYEEMLRNSEPQSGLRDPPKLREIMDMELAQNIYKADVNSLTQNSQETMASVLAKRLLEENFPNVAKTTLNDIFISCNCSFEDTVKTLQETLSTDDHNLGAQGFAQASGQRIPSYEQPRDKSPQKECRGVEESIGIENPWAMSDPLGHYETYRAKADQFLKERDEMYRKASDAFRRKERSAAAYYSKLGELIGKKYHHANSLAAAALAAAHTDSHSSETLDLHHFRVVEALTVFDLFMDHHIRTLPEHGLQQRSLDVITGRGTHSVNGRPRIKPAVLNRIKKRNLRYQAIPNNPGVVKVWVSANSLLSHEIPE